VVVVGRQQQRLRFRQWFVVVVVVVATYIVVVVGQGLADRDRVTANSNAAGAVGAGRFPEVGDVDELRVTALTAAGLRLLRTVVTVTGGRWRRWGGGRRPSRGPVVSGLGLQPLHRVVDQHGPAQRALGVVDLLHLVHRYLEHLTPLFLQPVLGTDHRWPRTRVPAITPPGA